MLRWKANGVMVVLPVAWKESSCPADATLAAAIEPGFQQDPAVEGAE